ncbi:MAG: permease [Myxococcota bacterium]|nr:permease [Myxococcota bacterium]
MWIGLAVAMGSVALGALIVLLGSRSQAALPPIRTFALVAAVVVVLAQLLPAALGEVGLWALAVFLLALVLPAGFERLARLSRRQRAGSEQADASWVAVEFGYFGLLVHRLGDGIALGLFAGTSQAEVFHPGALLALAAHTVPVTAVLVLAYAQRYGTTHAILRALGMALASAVGVLLVDAAPAALLLSAEPWILAAASGLLLHIIGHDWNADVPATNRHRLVDVLAIVAGLSLAFLGVMHGHGDGHSGGAMRETILSALADFTLETAPVLLLGLGIGALLQTLGGRISVRWLQSGSSVQQAIRGAVVGAPLPLCACGVLPLAETLKKKGAGPALVVAFLFATPELGVESFALTVQFLGWPFAIVRLVAAIGVAVIAALVIARHMGGATSVLQSGGEPLGPEPEEGASWSRFVHSFDELLHHVGPFTAIGLLAAAYLQAGLPDQAIDTWGKNGLDIFVVSIVAVPSYVCAAAATPLAAVLIAKGFSSGAVLAGLLLGPATNLATVAFLRSAFGPRATWIGLGALILAVWGIAALSNALGLESATALAETNIEHGHSIWALASTVLLGALVLRSVWLNGLRTWLATLGEALGTKHDHAHHH